MNDMVYCSYCFRPLSRYIGLYQWTDFIHTVCFQGFRPLSRYIGLYLLGSMALLIVGVD